MSTRSTSGLTVLIVSLGRSEVLDDLLISLAEQTPVGEILLIAQAWAPPPEVTERCDRVLELPKNLGFAAANNLGLAKHSSPYVALLNDDVILEPGWAEALVAELESDVTIGAAQGINLRYSDPEVIDGCGIEWNRWLQAVQVGHGQAVGRQTAEAREIFGVSATAAIYRRSALDQVTSATSSTFDQGLGSYYEDVDLACRLRSKGWKSVVVPRARTRHVGSATSRSLPLSALDLIYSNRHLVLGRVLGRQYWLQMPRILMRDLIDGLRAIVRGDWRALGAMGKAAVRVVGSFGQSRWWRAPLLRTRELFRGAI